MLRAAAIILLAFLHGAIVPWSGNLPCAASTDCMIESAVDQADDDAPPLCCCCCGTSGDDAAGCPCAAKSTSRPLTPLSAPTPARALGGQLVLFDMASVRLMPVPVVEWNGTGSAPDRPSILVGVSAQAWFCIWRT